MRGIGDAYNGEHAAFAGIDLNLLVALDALLQERSVTRAGQRLSVTQPSMSGILHRLRLLFDDELLVRAGNTMRPTPLAESLEAPLRDTLLQLHEAVFPSEYDPLSHARTFTIAATDYVAYVLIQPLLNRMRTVAPQVTIRIASARIGELTLKLQLDDADLVIVPSRFSGASSLPTKTLFTDRFVGATWQGNHEIDSAPTVEELGRLPYLGYRQGSVPTLVDRQLAAQGIPLEPSTFVESFLVGALMLRGTQQFTFLQEHLAVALRDSAELRLFAAPFESPTVVETMSWHPRATNDRGHRWLRDEIAQVAAEVNAGSARSGERSLIRG
jgi:DNA-binding transcriptional LysR family regulator